MLSNNSSYEDWFSTCQITPNYHGELLYSLVNMQLASRNPLLRTGRYWLSFFLARLTELRSLQNALWLPPSPSQNFREDSPIRRPQPSAGGASEEQQTPGALVFGSRKRLLLEAWPMHLELVSRNFRKHQKATLGSTSGRCKDALQDHGIWLWRSLTFGSLAATYEGKGKMWCAILLPDPGPRVAGGGSP